MKRTLTTLALATLLLAIPAAADGPAQLDKAGTSLNWNLDGSVHSLHLVLTGPDGERFEKTFPGGNISLDLAKLVDGNLADGRYTWEVRENLAPRTRGVDLPTKQASRSASGTFSIEGGTIVPDAVERLPTKDQVFNDDVIITFSLCVGTDCVNGESFGFDTIRLKENNLRIHFDDTSTSGSFPRNDWRIVANDTANGGASYLAVEDSTAGRNTFIVEAGAPSNALVVDSSSDSRIGVGTSSPSLAVHAVGGNTPGLRLEQNGSAGFTPQTWDLAGNEANFFVRDVTGGSLLSLRIRPGAPTSSVDIAADGGVGIGTASPSDADDLAEKYLDVSGGATGDARVIVDYGSGSANFGEFLMQEENTNRWSFGSAAGNDRFYIFNYTNSREDVTISDTTGQVTIHNGLSVTGGCTGCDAVFQPDWDLESIEEHAELMWKNSYLPGVGPTPEGQVTIDVFSKTTGILQELEKAHIYIEQLNDGLKAKDSRIAQLEARLEALEQALLD